VVSYVNTTAEVKALSDYCCTSSNAEAVIRSIPADREILFCPDMFLGAHLERVTGRKMHVWMGECHVHAALTPDVLAAKRQEYPDAEFLVHPECGCVTSAMYYAEADGDVAAGRTRIVSTEQILVRISAPNGQKAPYPSEAWPQETFPDRRKDYYMNHEGIQIYREPPAHSDSDSIVLFRGSDVVVTGDIIDANRFPVIDTAKGGSIQGEIDALNQVVDLSFRPMPFVFAEGGTLVVTGHGRIYDRQDVVEYRDMVVTIRDIIQDMIQRGMTLPQIKEASPAKAYEREYGAKSGSWTTENFVEAVYQGLTGKK